MINKDLVAAAQYMDEHGKCVGRFHDFEDKVCMVGALEKVIHDGLACNWLHGGKAAPEEKLRYWRALGLLNNYAIKIHGSTTYQVNDEILETKEETVKFMMEAAEWDGS